MQFSTIGYVRFDDGTVGRRLYCHEVGGRGECWRPLREDEVPAAKKWHAAEYPGEAFIPSGMPAATP